MGQWNHLVDVSAPWLKAQADELPIKDFITEFEAKAKFTLPPAFLEEIEPLIEEMKALEVDDETGDVDADEFDEVWNEIYTWADNRRVWIKTFM